ncbi:MAG TPA: glycosyltransferase [Candidatus Saccharimonadales bacterium]|nr:glycosyltransferase [Candidatus Saccharimonadales bacterium]
MTNPKNSTLIVLASTYPRWPNDDVPAFVADFVQNISSRFDQVRVITPHYKNAKRLEKKGNIMVRRFVYVWPFRWENIVYERGGGPGRVNLKSPVYLVKLLLLIESELRATFYAAFRSKNAVINAHWIIPQGLVGVVVGRLLGRKVVVTVHGSDIFTLNGSLLRKVKAFVLKHADAVVVNSSATLKACQALCQREYKVISMGIDPARFEQRRRPTQKDRPFTILFVGRLVAEKGALYVCQAAKSLYEKDQNIEVEIIGSGPQKPELENFIKKNKLGKVINLRGWVSPKDLPRYYQSADVFVGPSVEGKSGHMEAFGLVFAEAAAAGLPVIATDTGGIRDIVIDGKTGYLVKPESAEAISEKITKLKNDSKLRNAMGRAGQKYALENFSWESIVEHYAKVLKT